MRISSRWLTLTFLIVTHGLSLLASEAANPPNMVVFITDDQSQLDSSVYGAADIRTPNMERLADAGMTFTNAFVASPGCAPSRAALLTGLMPARNGAEPNHAKPRADIKKLPAYLQELGYEVVAFGKVAHYGHASFYGFDRFAVDKWMEQGNIAAALEYLNQRDSEEPVCLFVGTHEPHVPWPHNEGYDPATISLPPTHVDTLQTRLNRTQYYTAITDADAKFGQIYDRAREKLGKNTLFMFTSDHGAQWPFGKWNLYDAGIRVPLIVSWPGVIKSDTRTDAMVSWVDILPTLVELAGGSAPQDLDGRSFASVLRGNQSRHRDTIFTTHSGDGDFNVYPMRSVRDRNWKHILNLHPEFQYNTHINRAKAVDGRGYWDSWLSASELDAQAAAKVKRYHERPREELYDLGSDPHEQHNLAVEPAHAERIQSMRAELQVWMGEQGDRQTVYGKPKLIKDTETEAEVKARSACGIQPAELTCEYLNNPLVVDSASPRFSWQLVATDSQAFGLKQSAYQIRVGESPAALESDEELLWDSGRVPSDNTLHIRYAGEPLMSGQQCQWQVRVWDQEGVASNWSTPARFGIGLLSLSDWHGPWIGAKDDNETVSANQFYRKRFVLKDPPGDGIVYVASLGFHELLVNGQRVTDTVLAPAISDPLNRVRYVAYDVSRYLRQGENVLGVALGAGWTLYDGQGWPQETVDRWPHRPMLRVEGRIQTATEEVRTVQSDTTWRTHPADIQPLGRWQFRDFNGEQAIIGEEQSEWSAPGFDDSAWGTAETRDDHVVRHLTAENVEPNRIVETIAAAKVEKQKPGVYRVTLEKMFNGFLDVELTGQPNALVTIEVSDREEESCVYNQRHELKLDANGHGRFRNRFNYTTGRWITVRGDIDPPDRDRVRGLLVSTDLARAGTFRCSDEYHNRLYETALHTFRCLSLGGYVVDCSHRERLGYGDGQVANMLMFPNYKVGAFLTKWLEDWCDVQQPDGNLPFTAPTYSGGGGPMWSGFVVHAAADVHEYYADREIVKRIYPTIRAWLAFLESHVIGDQLQRYAGPAGFIRPQWSFLGDWVAPGQEQSPNGDSPETHFLNNSYYAWTLHRAASMARLLGKEQEALQYDARAKTIAVATHKKYWDDERQNYGTGRQAELSLALLAEIVPEEWHAEIERQLEEQIRVAHDGHIDTGIMGTLFLMRALQKIDRPDLAFLIADQRDYPGWGHMIEQGATTLWEEWDGDNSRCHSSFLEIGGWYVESIAGIQHDPARPGFKHFFIKPGLVDGLTWAEGSLDSPRGTIRSSWRRDDDALTLEVTVPPNTTATVCLPLTTSETIKVNGHITMMSSGVRASNMTDQYRTVDVASGNYLFAISR